jgi:hypothetical protein
MDLIASFFWGTVGFAIFLFGKKAGELAPILIGILMMVISYFLGFIALTIVSILLLVGLWWQYKN